MFSLLTDHEKRCNPGYQAHTFVFRSQILLLEKQILLKTFL